MKVTLYMAISADGYIARTNGDTPWSDAHLSQYAKKVTSIGALIVGRVTYDLMNEGGDFHYLKGVTTIIVTSNPQPSTEHRIFVKSPEEAITYLESQGFTECVVAGGSKLNHSFLSKNLLDEVYLDVEPHIFGAGITLIGGAYKDMSLELIKSFSYGKGGIALRYKIKNKGDLPY
jgi:dihydrofolate reductase